MDEIHGNIDDDDSENEDSQPKRMSAALQAIRSLMASEGIDYNEAYDRIINHKKKPEPEPLPVPLPPPQPQPKQQPTLELIAYLNDLVTSLNSDAEQIELQKEEVARFEEDVGKRNVHNIELNSTLKQQLSQIKEFKKALTEREKQYEHMEATLNEQLEKFNKQVEDFNTTVEAHKKKRKTTTQKIKQVAKAEFEKET